MLRLEAQDLLHLRHVPQRRSTFGGETPERSPGREALMPRPLQVLQKAGTSRGTGEGLRRGARAGGSFYAVQAQGRRARARPRCPAS